MSVVPALSVCAGPVCVCRPCLCVPAMSEVPTLQTVDEPHELFLGDVGVAQVQGHRLSPDDAAQHGGGDGALVAQVDLGPQPLVTTPGGTGGYGTLTDQ